MNECAIPALEDIAGVYVVVSCESLLQDWKDIPSEEVADRIAMDAYRSLKDYFKPFATVRPELECSVDPDHLEHSEHTGEACYAWKQDAYLTVKEWVKLADAYCIDLEGRAVPERHTYTMGIITADGLVPAVSIDGTDEGWNSGYYEPSLIASFYVAVMMEDTQ